MVTRNKATRQRSGLTLIEVAVSAVVLGVVLTTVVQIIQWSAAEHRAAQRKRCALEAATSVLDQISVHNWDAITPKSAAAFRLPPDVARALLDPQLVVTVDEEKESAATTAKTKPADSLSHDSAALRGKRIAVEVTWTNRPGGKKEHVRLSTWVFRQVGGTD
jgi:Tfp pilus assembly protein PilV